MRQVRKVTAAAAVGLVLALLMGLSLAGTSVVTQAAGPTPVSVSVFSERPSGPFYWFDGEVITEATNSTAYQLSSAELLDVQTTIDQGSSSNAITLTLQYSIDKSNWTDGADLVTASAADATDLQQFPMFGAWVRIAAVVTNTNAVTVTAVGLAK